MDGCINRWPTCNRSAAARHACLESRKLCRVGTMLRCRLQKVRDTFPSLCRGASRFRAEATRLCCKVSGIRDKASRIREKASSIWDKRSGVQVRPSWMRGQPSGFWMRPAWVWNRATRRWEHLCWLCPPSVPPASPAARLTLLRQSPTLDPQLKSPPCLNLSAGTPRA